MCYCLFSGVGMVAVSCRDVARRILLPLAILKHVFRINVDTHNITYGEHVGFKKTFFRIFRID